jgi:acyl dehydratase
MSVAMNDADLMYAEDLTPGQQFPFGSWTVTEEEIIAFGTAWDPQPIHVDRQAAGAGPFGGVIASGLHTLGIYQRLMIEALGGRLAGKAGRELRFRLLRPVRPGATLTGAAELTDIRPRPERGDAVLCWTAWLNHGDQRVFEIDGEAIIFLRPG